MIGIFREGFFFSSSKESDRFFRYTWGPRSYSTFIFNFNNTAIISWEKIIGLGEFSILGYLGGNMKKQT